MHNLMTLSNGKAAFSAATPAWHRLGNIVGRFQTAEEILSASGCDYSVFKSQLNDGRGNKVSAWSTFRWNRADMEAKDGEKAVWIGNVGEDYKIIPHQVGFEIVDSLVQSVDGAHWSTCGALGNGERVFGVADLSMSMNVGDDMHQSFLMFATGHDGSLSFQFRTTNVRVVCQNTLSAALSSESAAKLNIRHTKNSMNRVADVQATLASIQNDVKTVEQRLRFLASRRMDRETVTTVLDRLFPKSKGDDKTESSTKRNNILADVLKLYESNDNNAFPEQAGTAYALLNACTAYTDHVRSSKNDQRALSAMWGSGDALKTKALEVLTVAAGSLAPMPTRQTFATVSTGGSLLDDVLSATVEL